MKNQSYKIESIKQKYLNNMQKNQVLKVKDVLLKLEKDFIESKDREVKRGRDRRVIFQT